MTYFINTLD